MKLTIEMHDPERTIIREIADLNMSQGQISITYAFLIAQARNTTDWPKVNSAIQERWKGKTALKRIKESAWKIVDEWNRKGKEAEVNA